MLLANTFVSVDIEYGSVAVEGRISGGHQSRPIISRPRR